MSTRQITDLAYRIRINLSMEPTPGTNAMALAGPHDLDAASALINAGLELLLHLGRHDPIVRATAIVLLRKLPARFEDAIRDPARPAFTIVE